MVVQCKGKTFGREDVERAMERFDREMRHGFRRWKTYSVKHNDKHYPPKELLRLLIGNVGSPGGGEPTNRYFRELGFQIAAGEVTDEDVTPPEQFVDDAIDTSLSLEADLEEALVAKRSI